MTQLSLPLVAHHVTTSQPEGSDRALWALFVAEASGSYRPATADELVGAALQAMRRATAAGEILSSPQAVGQRMQLELGALEHEVFAVAFVDAQHRLLSVEQMFRGTLSCTSVYPREVVKRALQLNAGAVFLGHNHPSGSLEPSRADEHLTQTLKTALALIDVRVLDHLVVGRHGWTSFAQRGLL